MYGHPLSVLSTGTSHPFSVICWLSNYASRNQNGKNECNHGHQYSDEKKRCSQELCSIGTDNQLPEASDDEPQQDDYKRTEQKGWKDASRDLHTANYSRVR